MIFGSAVLAVGVVGCSALIWWRHRYLPSTSALWASWTAFLWGYFKLLGLATTPANLVPRAAVNAVLLGIPIVAAAWFIARLRSSQS
ncbi:hypothetical protein [Sphingomonas nostoxanthinifaciens]|uniref:hypothetical protein n=1 Tax=Sphingomonas nostoxanthinifaciens TaxID=2872652 RepID=UPI001CC1FFEC|nr:hypothetical protein [Sphingomonas nostoxanthinifaciens]UAK23619.1 hypothetical protein K8P63_14675 [Sphingomonas nostoxanthinifaciens]UAK23624.1 hypothetical protein K8P63_14705 [Sphingomonas nostoxanthinifaciens]